MRSQKRAAAMRSPCTPKSVQANDKPLRRKSQHKIILPKGSPEVIKNKQKAQDKENGNKGLGRNYKKLLN